MNRQDTLSTDQAVISVLDYEKGVGHTVLYGVE